MQISKEKDIGLAQYLFHEGTNYKAHEYLGAHLQGKICTFRTWAPNAKQVFVTGDFCEWDTTVHEAARITDGGIFECVVDGIKQFDNYKFVIITNDGKEVLKADPYAFHSETRPNNASKVYKVGKYKWQDSEWVKNRKNLSIDDPVNIYELHFSSWRKYSDGNVFSYEKMGDELLPYVKDMGYTHIELMPMSEYPYDKSWGYQVTGYYAPTSRYGTPDEFMHFIDRCHAEGIGVILDWVPAHFPKDEHGLYEFDGTCCYEYKSMKKREHAGWNTRIFDYGRNEVKSFLISSADYWFDKYHVDGMRVDAVAAMLYLDYDKENGQWEANEYGGNGNMEAVEFLKSLNDWIINNYKGAMMIAEESTSWPKITFPIEEGGLGFTYKWNMGWMNDTLLYISQDPLFRKGVHSSLTFSFTYAFSEKYILPISHDEVVHGKGSLFQKMPGTISQKYSNMRAYVGYMYAHPGKKLSFMGNEIAQETEWNEEEELQWKLLATKPHLIYRDFVRTLNEFYLTQPALWEQDTCFEGFDWASCGDDENNVISFYRIDKKGNKLLIVCNFSSNIHEDYKIGVKNKGVYNEIFSTDAVAFGGSGVSNGKITAKAGAMHGCKQHLVIDLPALSTIFIYKKNMAKKAKED